MDPTQQPTGNIPPQALAALQQQQSGGMDITAILAQLAEMSPDEVSQALQQLGINVDPDTLHEAAQQWVENAGDKQTGASEGEGEATSEEPATDEATPAPAPAPAPTTDDEAAEATPDDEAAEGEGAEGNANVATPGQGGASSNYTPRVSGANRGAPPNASNIAAASGRRGGGMNMDALISAALSQGDPNSMPPPMRPPGVGQAPTPAPTPAAGQDPRIRAMIGSIYRDAAARRGVPQVPQPRAAAATATAAIAPRRR